MNQMLAKRPSLTEYSKVCLTQFHLTAPDAMPFEYQTASLTVGALSGAYYALCDAREELETRSTRVREWIERAESEVKNCDIAFDVPNNAYFVRHHLESGLATGRGGFGYIRVQLAAQTGDRALLARGLAELVASWRAQRATEDPPTELFMGASGYLRGASILLEEHRNALSAAQREILEIIRREALAATCERYEGRALRDANDSLGFAHGVTGEVYALVRAHDAPDELVRRLVDELAAQATKEGTLVAWPTQRDGDVPSPMWSSLCNGVVGQTLVFAHAYRRWGELRHKELAEQCGHTLVQLRNPTAHLCCGAAGQAFGMFTLARVLGSKTWLGRARRRLQVAFALNQRLPPNFMQGSFGLGWLAERILRPKADYPRHPLLD